MNLVNDFGLLPHLEGLTQAEVVGLYVRYFQSMAGGDAALTQRLKAEADYANLHWVMYGRFRHRR